MKCKKCGQEVNQDANFCGNCGEQITVNQFTSAGQSITARNKQNSKVWVKIILGVIGVPYFIYFLFESITSLPMMAFFFLPLVSIVYAGFKISKAVESKQIKKEIRFLKSTQSPVQESPHFQSAFAPIGTSESASSTSKHTGEVISAETKVVEKNTSIDYKYPLSLFGDGTYEYRLKYSYNDVFVAYSDTFDLSAVSVGNFVQIKEEPTNEYDSQALAVMFRGVKLGYIPKNKLQSMVHDFRERDGEVLAKVVSKDKNLIISMGFYDEEETKLSKLLASDTKRKSFKLVGNANSEMQENIGCCEIAEEVTFDYDVNADKILSYCNCEIGYVPKSAEEYINELASYSAFVENIQESSNDKLVVKVVVFEK